MPTKIYPVFESLLLVPYKHIIYIYCYIIQLKQNKGFFKAVKNISW